MAAFEFLALLSKTGTRILADMYRSLEKTWGTFVGWLRGVRDQPPQWALVVAIVSVLIQTLVLAQYYSRHSLKAGLAGDAAIFQHAGWYLANGGHLYLDIWEVKLPLAYEIPALVAVVTGDNMVAHHLVSLLLTNLSLVATTCLLAAIVYRLTGSRHGAIVAGLTPFILPSFSVAAIGGYKSKYFLLAFGFASITLQQRSRPVASGIAAGGAASFYQLGVFFPVIVVLMAWIDEGRKSAAKTVAGGVVLAAITIAPVFVWGAVREMLQQTLIVHLMVSESQSLSDVLVTGFLGVKRVGYGLPVVIAGVVGLYHVRADLRTRWWIGVGAAWFGFGYLFFDAEGPPDLFPILSIVALGAGLCTAVASEDRRRLVGAFLVLGVVLAVGLGGLVPSVGDDVSSVVSDTVQSIRGNADGQASSGTNDTDGDALGDQFKPVQSLYWNATIPDSCWYSYQNSGDLRDWIAHRNATTPPRTCTVR